MLTQPLHGEALARKVYELSKEHGSLVFRLPSNSDLSLIEGPDGREHSERTLALAPGYRLTRYGVARSRRHFPFLHRVEHPIGCHVLSELNDELLNTILEQIEDYIAEDKGSGA